MKIMFQKFLKLLSHLLLLLLLFCFCSAFYYKIKYPESRFTVFGYQFYVEITNSMAPELQVNDILVVKKCAKESLKVGDIITFREKDTTITHRIIEIIDDKETRYRTKGDNNNTEDDTLIAYEEIEGKYIFKIRYLGFFLLDKISLVLLIIFLFLISFFPYKKLSLFGMPKADEDLDKKC